MDAALPAIDLAAEAGSGLLDWLAVAAVALVALGFLARGLLGRRRRSGCSGCAGCGPTDATCPRPPDFGLPRPGGPGD